MKTIFLDIRVHKPVAHKFRKLKKKHKLTNTEFLEFLISKYIEAYGK